MAGDLARLHQGRIEAATVMTQWMRDYQTERQDETDETKENH